MSEAPWNLFTVGDKGVLIPKSRPVMEWITGRYAIGKTVRVKTAQDRSKPQHNLYWEVLRRVVESTDQWVEAEDLHNAIKLHLKMLRGFTLIGGGVHFEPRSTNFNTMDQAEFDRYFKRAMLAIEEATSIDTDELIQEILKEWSREAA